MRALTNVCNIAALIILSHSLLASFLMNGSTNSTQPERLFTDLYYRNSLLLVDQLRGATRVGDEAWVQKCLSPKHYYYNEQNLPRAIVLDAKMLGKRAFHIALDNGYNNIAVRLLENGAYFCTHSPDRVCALEEAGNADSLRVLEILTRSYGTFWDGHCYIKAIDKALSKGNAGVALYICQLAQEVHVNFSIDQQSFISDTKQRINEDYIKKIQKKRRNQTKVF